MIRQFSMACGVLALVAGAAMAQFSITPGGANAGNGFFANGTLAASITGAGNTNADFTTTTTAGSNQMFQSNWWFRQQGDNREFVFGNGSSAGYTVSGVTNGTNDGTLNTGGYDFTVSGAASFRSTQRWSIFNNGMDGVQVLKTNTITNTGSTPLNLVLFSYDDFDVDGSFGGDAWTWTGSQYDVTDDPFTISYGAFGADARQAADFSALRDLLANGSANTLNNTDGDGSGDFTGAFQWNLSIGAGETVTVAAAFTINGPLVPAPGALALAGLGGAVALRRRR